MSHYRENYTECDLCHMAHSVPDEAGEPCLWCGAVECLICGDAHPGEDMSRVGHDLICPPCMAEDVESTPAIGSRWQHESGAVYVYRGTNTDLDPIYCHALELVEPAPLVLTPPGYVMHVELPWFSRAAKAVAS